METDSREMFNAELPVSIAYEMELNRKIHSLLKRPRKFKNPERLCCEGL